MNEPIEENWICPWCGNDEVWFDRTIGFLPNGEEAGMTDRCTQCGKSTDDLPEAEIAEEVVDVVEEPTESDLREESY